MREIIFNFQMTMAAPAMLDHLQAISKEETSCTLVTSLGERVEVKFILLLTDIFYLQYFQVQSFLLAAISPYLASLLSQVDFPPAPLLLFWQKEASPAVCSLFDLI